MSRAQKKLSPAYGLAASEPLRIVSIGGGTGLSTLLSGLKQYVRGVHDEPPVGDRVVDITAVVTVSDDGGSSGRLRRDFDILPPGDIRNCMVALSEDEALLSKLFQFRFNSGRGLKGHSFGNLFLAALNHLTDDFADAVKLSSEILAIRGRIFPATSANITLEARLADGTRVRGESTISKSRSPITEVRLKPKQCKPIPDTLEAIAKADLITLGPGSLYTSVIPNLLVSGISEAIKASPALKVYFVNLMWQPGETLHFSASQHVKAIHDHAQRKLIDCVVVNTAPISKSLKRKYAAHKVQPVENDFENLEKMNVTVVSADLVSKSSLVRHDSKAVADIVVDLAWKSRIIAARRHALRQLKARK